MLWLILIVALLVEPCPIGTGVPDAERRLEGDGLAGGDAGYYVGISGLSLHSPRYKNNYSWLFFSNCRIGCRFLMTVPLNSLTTSSLGYLISISSTALSNCLYIN